MTEDDAIRNALEYLKHSDHYRVLFGELGKMREQAIRDLGSKQEPFTVMRQSGKIDAFTELLDLLLPEWGEGPLQE